MIRPLRLSVEAVELGSPPFIDFDLVKKHVRAADFTDDDTLLQAYLLAGVKWCENATHRTIYRRAHQWVLREFETCADRAIRLPRGKSVSVDNIVCSINGAGVTLTGPTSVPPGTDYQEDLRGDEAGVIVPARGASWPSVDSDVPAPIVINFTAGYSAEEIAAEADLLHAILFCVADAYDLRGTADFSADHLSQGGPRYAAREALVSAYRLQRIY